MNVQIRSCIAADIPELVELTRQWGYETTAEKMKEHLRRIEEAPNADVYVAIADGKVAGRIFVREHLSLGSSSFAEVHDLVVNKDYRRAGIGKQLIEKVKQWGREKGLGLLRLRTNIKREEANVFYPQIGFMLDKVQNVYVINL